MMFCNNYEPEPYRRRPREPGQPRQQPEHLALEQVAGLVRA